LDEWSPDPRNFSKLRKRGEVRRQNRIADFVRPQLQPGEQIVAILSRLYGRLERYEGTVGTDPLAVAITTQRLIVLGLRDPGWSRQRPKKILETYPRDSLTVEWDRYPRYQQGESRFGELRIGREPDTRIVWFESWMRRHAHAVVLDMFGRLDIWNPLQETGHSRLGVGWQRHEEGADGR